MHKFSETLPKETLLIDFMSPIGCSLLSGYHADTPITIKAEAIHEADSRIH